MHARKQSVIGGIQSMKSANQQRFKSRNQKSPACSIGAAGCGRGKKAKTKRERNEVTDLDDRVDDLN